MRYLLLFLTFIAVGCSSVSEQRSKVISIGVQKVESALSAGRFDLARKYSAELVKVVPQPKKFSAVKSVESQGQRAIVLPSAFSAAPVILEDSHEFKLAIQPTQAREEARELEGFKTAVADSVRKTYQEAGKASSRGILGLIPGLSIAGVIGVVILCAFFPALLPLFGNLFRLVVSGVNWFVSVARKILS